LNFKHCQVRRQTVFNDLLPDNDGVDDFLKSLDIPAQEKVIFVIITCAKTVSNVVVSLKYSECRSNQLTSIITPLGRHLRFYVINFRKLIIDNDTKSYIIMSLDFPFVRLFGVR
jgi:hypothetical protein